MAGGIVFLSGVLSAGLLRSGQLRSGGSRFWLLLVAWSVIAATIALSAYPLGAVRGPFIALTLLPLGALVFVAMKLQVKPARNKSRSPAVAPRGRFRALKGFAHVLGVCIASALAALLAGAAVAAWVPGPPADRIVFSGILAAILWAAAIAWALWMNRPVRSLVILLAVALTSGLLWFAKTV